MADVSSKAFGGHWSDEKLDALKAYLHAYTTALKNTPFKLAYIDAFAGAGTREVQLAAEDSLFEETLSNEEASYRHGSPLIALENEPPFDSFIFIERDAQSLAKLAEEVSRNYLKKADSVAFKKGDANEILQDLAGKNWAKRRAVAFLDPFALQVTWETIERIARTRAIDMWLLFPAMAINRMLPRSGEVPASWAAKLTESFGSEEWRDYFYQKQPVDLFGEEQVGKVQRVFEALSDFITLRLKTVFAGVNSKPMILRNSTEAPLFLLCFACGNPKGAKVALKIAQHIINKKNHGH